MKYLGVVKYRLYQEKRSNWTGGFSEITEAELVEFDTVQELNNRYTGNSDKIMVGFELLHCKSCNEKEKSTPQKPEIDIDKYMEQIVSMLNQKLNELT